MKSLSLNTPDSLTKTVWNTLCFKVPFLIACGFAVAGCSGQNSTTSSNNTSSTATTTESVNTSADAKPITMGYSDWPGYVVWDIAEKKGFFKKNGVNVKLKWFPVYTDSLNALSAGQVDMNNQVWSDAMAPLAQGLDLKVVLVNDNSYGNDALIAQPGISSVKDLKGKKVASELGTCDHFMLLKALEANGMTEKDIQFVNIKIQDCPSAMLAKTVDAANVWEPSRTKILKSIKGSKELYTSRQMPGLLADVVMANADLVKNRPDDVQKIVDTWYESLDWMRENRAEAIKIMAARTDTPVSEYADFIKGTRLFSSSEGVTTLTKKPTPISLYSTSDGIAKFLLKAQQLDKIPDWESAIEPKFVQNANKKGLGKLPPFDY